MTRMAIGQIIAASNDGQRANLVEVSTADEDGHALEHSRFDGVQLCISAKLDARFG